MPVVWGIVEHSPIVTWFANFFVSEYCLSGDSKASFNSDNLSFVLQVYNSIFFLLNAWTSENFVNDVQPLACRILEHLDLLKRYYLKKKNLFQSIPDQLDHQLLNCLVCLFLKLQIKISFLFIFLFWKLFFKLFWLIY